MILHISAVCLNQKLNAVERLTRAISQDEEGGWDSCIGNVIAFKVNIEFKELTKFVEALSGLEAFEVLGMGDLIRSQKKELRDPLGE